MAEQRKHARCGDIILDVMNGRLYLVEDHTESSLVLIDLRSGMKMTFSRQPALAYPLVVRDGVYYQRLSSTRPMVW